MTEPTPEGLTPEEQEILDTVGSSFRAFDKLDVYHSADRDEFAFHVHAIGRIVMSRAAIRAHPKRLRPGGGGSWDGSPDSPP